VNRSFSWWAAGELGNATFTDGTTWSLTDIYNSAPSAQTETGTASAGGELQTYNVDLTAGDAYIHDDSLPFVSENSPKTSSI